MQSKKHSFIEANTNTFIGFGIGFLMAYTVLPLYGIEQSVRTSIEITSIYTIISIIRNYIVRRFFNKVTLKKGGLDGRSKRVTQNARNS